MNLSSSAEFLKNTSDGVLDQSKRMVGDVSDFAIRVMTESHQLSADIGHQINGELTYKELQAEIECLRTEVTALQTELQVTKEDLAKAEYEKHYAETHDNALLHEMFNRRGLSEHIKKYVEYNKPKKMHCFFMDVRDFSEFNVKYGQSIGDDVLVAVGWFMQEFFKVSEDELGVNDKEYSLVGRFGGDEFVMVLPDKISRGDKQLFGDSLTHKRIDVDGKPNIYKEITALNLNTFIRHAKDEHIAIPENVSSAISNVIDAIKQKSGDDAIIELQVNGKTIDEVSPPDLVEAQFYRVLKEFDMKTIRSTAGRANN